MGLTDLVKSRNLVNFVMPPIKAKFPKIKRYRKSKEQLIIEHLGCKCDKCGSTDDLELDHIVPLSQGGDDTIENLQVLCSACHAMKSYQEGSFPTSHVIRPKNDKKAKPIEAPKPMSSIVHMHTSDRFQVFKTINELSGITKEPVEIKKLASVVLRRYNIKESDLTRFLGKLECQGLIETLDSDFVKVT